MTVAAPTILSELGLDNRESEYEPRAVRATITAASPDVALLKVIGPDPYEAVMPVTEFYPNHEWHTGETYILEQLGPPPRPLLSAIRPELIPLLLDGYAPEVRSGLVRIMGVARAAGVRTKLAVAATEVGVDPVAACIGRNANRVRAVGQLLCGERIDVIAWNPDLVTYLRNALAPAAVTDIVVKGDRAVAVAPVHQMSAAVGGGGLNASLAGQLVGLKVVVVPEGTDPEAQVEAELTATEGNEPCAEELPVA